MVLATIAWAVAFVILGVLAYCAACVLVLLYVDVPDDSPYPYVTDAVFVLSFPFVLGAAVVLGKLQS